MPGRYRVKLIVDFPDCKDVHVFHAGTLPDAEQLGRELREDLAEVEHLIFIYADTRNGHIRVR